MKWGITPAREHHLMILLIVTMVLAAIVLSIQLPFAYYSGDMVFHAAKILAAKDGEYFTEPVSGYKILYVSLFHLIWGNVARWLDLSAFQVTRIIQVFNFLGLLFSGYLLGRVLLKRNDLAVVSAFSLVFLIYSPTGKYVFLQIPYTFSLPIFLVGAACLLAFVESGSRRHGILGGCLLGVAITVWWWNVVPLAGLAVASMYTLARGGIAKPSLKKSALVLVGFGLPLLYNVWAFYEIRELLSANTNAIGERGFAAGMTLFQTMTQWVATFALKANLRFMHYLLPGALHSGSLIGTGYGIVSSVYFYLVVLPFNALMIYFSAKDALGRRRSPDLITMLWIAGVTVLVLSFVEAFLGDPDVLGRIQFYVYVFMLPGFIRFASTKISPRLWQRWQFAICAIGALAVLYLAVYSNSLTQRAPISADTRQVIDFVERIPNHSETRLFLSSYDTKILAREVRFRGFVIEPNPIYFRVPIAMADSIYQAYNSIFNMDDRAEEHLRYYRAQYAVIGKRSVCQSPDPSRLTENTCSGTLQTNFRRLGTVAFENEEWVIIKLQ
jgi:hypothetical protein